MPSTTLVYGFFVARPLSNLDETHFTGSAFADVLPNSFKKHAETVIGKEASQNRAVSKL